MTQLAWKEWYELRKLPWISAIAVALLIVLTYICANTAGNHKFTENVTINPLLAVWGIVALYAGASLFSHEIHTGGLTFLSALPVPRRSIWIAKAAMGLVVVCISVWASYIAWALTDQMILGRQYLGYNFSYTLVVAPFSLGPTFLSNVFVANSLIVVNLFALGICLSPLFDRVVNAVCAAGALFIAGAMEIMNVAQSYAQRFETHAYTGAIHRIEVYRQNLAPSFAYQEPSLFINFILVLTFLTLVAVSYYVFTRGDSLRTNKRFRLAGQALCVCIALASVTIWTGFQLHLW